MLEQKGRRLSRPDIGRQRRFLTHSRVFLRRDPLRGPQFARLRLAPGTSDWSMAFPRVNAFQGCR
jgi:hypothetical protein